MINDKLTKEFQNIIKYKFQDIENLKNSLIHSSIFRNNKKYKNEYIYEFERLEFLGDRVLGLIVAFLIFEKFKDYNEGDLSKKFSKVCTNLCEENKNIQDSLKNIEPKNNES